jgi:outer membrane protein assembly factor BamB
MRRSGERRGKIRILAVVVALVVFGVIEAVSAEEAPIYSFGSIQLHNNIQIAQGESFTTQLRFYNIHGNRMAHLLVEVESTLGLEVTIKPPLQTREYKVKNETCEIMENLALEPSEVVSQVPSMVPEGIVYVQSPSDPTKYIPTKEVNVTIKVSEDAEIKTYLLKITATARWLPKEGCEPTVIQPREFKFNIQVSAINETEEPLTLLWKKDIKYANVVAINDGIVAIGFENNLSVFDINGTFLWSFEVPPTGFPEVTSGVCSLDIGHGMVVIGSGWVFAFDLNGTHLWTFKQKGEWNLQGFKVAIGRDRVVVAQDNVSLFLLDFSGKVVWENETIGKTSYYFYNVVVDNKTILAAIASRDGMAVQAFDYNGNLSNLSDQEVEEKFDKLVRSKKSYRDKYIVRGNIEGTVGKLGAFDLQSNKWEYRLWEHSFKNSWIRDLVISDDLLLVATNGDVALFRINYTSPANITPACVETEVTPTITQWPTQTRIQTPTPSMQGMLASVCAISLIIAFTITRRLRKWKDQT